jgi:hypothetical protein
MAPVFSFLHVVSVQNWLDVPLSVQDAVEEGVLLQGLSLQPPLSVHDLLSQLLSMQLVLSVQ